MSSKNDNLVLEKKVNKNKKKKKINRCNLKDCKKKLNDIMIITNKCKCEKCFCNLHKNPDKHSCDYKPSREEYIKKIKLGVCIADKFTKI